MALSNNFDASEGIELLPMNAKQMSQQQHQPSSSSSNTNNNNSAATIQQQQQQQLQQQQQHQHHHQQYYHHGGGGTATAAAAAAGQSLSSSSQVQQPSSGGGIAQYPTQHQHQHQHQPSNTGLTPIMKRANSSCPKKLQFSTPECSVTQISTIPGINSRLMPSRRREEAMVMANLRKRVAAVDLTRRRPQNTNAGDESNANDTGQQEPLLDNRSQQQQQQPQPQQQQHQHQHQHQHNQQLPKVASKRDMNAGEDSPKSVVLQDKDFILDCLCWHNEYRARHGATALTVSPELCEYSQNWANHLASTNEFYYRSEKSLGQNLFCCPISALVTDLTGQEVASYWYSNVRRYNYFKEPHLLHTNVNAGHFTQMVWVSSRYFGVGKATSRTGKIFVVAYYFPPGNIVGAFQDNVLPPGLDQDAVPGASGSGVGQNDFDNNNPLPSILKSGSNSTN